MLIENMYHMWRLQVGCKRVEFLVTNKFTCSLTHSNKHTQHSTVFISTDIFYSITTSVQPTSLAHHSYTQNSITATHCRAYYGLP